MCERQHTGGPIRQLSLQQSPATASRHPLKKQQSLDAVRLCSSASSNASGDGSLRVTASSMRTGGHFPQEPITSRPTSGPGAVIRTRAVKLAWADNKQRDNSKKNVELVAKRCVGQHRPVSLKIHRSAAGNLPNIGGSMDTILYTRQQLAERLRRAWREREQSRPNLDIFLAHSNMESTGEDDPLAVDPPAHTIQSPSHVTKDTSSDGFPYPSTFSNNSQDLNCGIKKNLPCALNNASHSTCFSTTLGISTNLSLQNKKTLLMKSNQPLKPTGINVVNGCTDVLNRADKEYPNEMERQERTVTTQNSSADESVSNNQQRDLQRQLNVGGPMAKINFNVFPKPNTTLSVKSPVLGCSAESKELQNHKNIERNSTVNHSSNKFTVILEQTVDKCPDKSNVIKEKPPTRIETSVTGCIINFHETTAESNHGSKPNGTITVKVSPRRKEALLADSITPSSTVYVESSKNSCTEHKGEEDLKISKEGTRAYEINVNSTRSLETVNNKVVQPSHSHAITPPEIMSATARRVNFRNSVNKTITGSFSSDMLPTPAGSGVTRSTAAPPLNRALSAPGRSILVHRNKNGTSVDISSDVTDAEDGEESGLQERGDRKIMSASARRRLRTAGPRRATRIRGEESSGDEAEGGAKQKPPPPRVGRRGLPRGAEIVTMVSLLSDGSDADEDPNILPQPLQWLEEKQNPAEQKQTEQIVCLRKSQKSVSFQQPPSTMRANSALPATVRGRPAHVRDSAVTPAGNTSGNTPFKGPSRENNRPKAITVQHTKAEFTPPNREQPVADCIIDVPPKDCAETASPEEREALPPNEDLPASPSEASVFMSEPPCTGLGVMVARILRPEPKAITEPVGSQDGEPKFQSPKERECWQLYRRMLEKGVSVSYDTVLRGMLTPTEYRLRRNALLSTC